MEKRRVRPRTTEVWEEFDPLTDKDIEEWLIGYLGVHMCASVTSIVEASGESKHTIVPVLYRLQDKHLCIIWRNQNNELVVDTTKRLANLLTNRD